MQVCTLAKEKFQEEFEKSFVDSFSLFVFNWISPIFTWVEICYDGGISMNPFEKAVLAISEDVSSLIEAVSGDIASFASKETSPCFIVLNEIHGANTEIIQGILGALESAAVLHKNIGGGLNLGCYERPRYGEKTRMLEKTYKESTCYDSPIIVKNDLGIDSSMRGLYIDFKDVMNPKQSNKTLNEVTLDFHHQWKVWTKRKREIVLAEDPIVSGECVITLSAKQDELQEGRQYCLIIIDMHKVVPLRIWNQFERVAAAELEDGKWLGLEGGIVTLPEFSPSYAGQPDLRVLEKSESLGWHYHDKNYDDLHHQIWDPRTGRWDLVEY
jgi:hypothetical protein